jgi:hypothetical protein
MRKFLLFALLLNTLTGMAQVTLTNSPYVENFDGIGNGLPAGFSVNTGFTQSSVGINSTFNSNATSWNNVIAGFSNCASATGLITTSNPTQQANSSNRALAVRQTASFGNPGSAFVFRIANTTNLTDFRLTFKLLSLDTTSEGRTVWKVSYGVGANPTLFTDVSSNNYTGGVPGTSNFKFSRDISVNFGSALNQKSDIVWIVVWTPVSTTTTSVTGNGIPTMSGIDDWNLSWTSPNPPLNVVDLNQSLEKIKISGFIGNEINIQFNEVVNNKTVVRLTNMNGAILWEKQYGRIQANQTEWVRPGQLPKGIYLLQIQNSEGRITKRIAN